jgi:spore germination protein YaaH
VDVITTEAFLSLCRKAKLTHEDMEIMTIGMCLDYIEEYVDMNNPKKSSNRKATQSDFDSF